MLTTPNAQTNLRVPVFRNYQIFHFFWPKNSFFSTLQDSTLIILDPKPYFDSVHMFFFGEILLKFLCQALGFEAFFLKLAKTMHKIKKCCKYYSPKIICPGSKKCLGVKKKYFRISQVLKNVFLGPKIVKDLNISKNQNSVICLSIGGGQQCWAGDQDIVRPLDLIC